jgi:glutamate-1-semialdehyde 2,1-aminomutase
MGSGQELYRKARKIIPGGTQLLSKRPEQFLPEQWPAYYSKSKGCEVWDLDGQKYVDMSYMGIGACTLGYADPDVNLAVSKCIADGNMTTLNAPEEVELANLLIQLHPWANMVRYARTGGEAMAVAIRIARAKTKRSIVLFSGYHGWHDWYLAANKADEKALDGKLLPGLDPVGVPDVLKGTAYPFVYNNTEEFMELLAQHGDNIGAVVAETVRNSNPDPEFMDTLVRETKNRRVPLIFDEISSGFRVNTGGAHLLLDVEPDIAVFAKGMSNGFPMAAIIGKSWVMDSAQDTFISSTYWTERIGPVAAIATINKMLECKVQDHLMQTGELVQQGWQKLSDIHKLDIKVYGIYPLSHFRFPESNLELKTLFTQEMLKRGFLATTAFYASYAHDHHHITEYLDAVNQVFATIAKAIREKEIKKYLEVPICQSGFTRLA